MTPIDVSDYYSGITASNSSHQIAETMALHQTIKAQVEEITNLHQTIQDQIRVTDQQSKLIRWLSYFVAALTVVQTAATVVQVIQNKPDQPVRTESAKQQVGNKNNPPNNRVSNTVQPIANHAPSVGKKP